MRKNRDKSRERISRRRFLADTISAAGGLGVMAATGAVTHAAGSDKLRIGLIGCGTRGTQAAIDCIESSPAVELVTMGDIFSGPMGTSGNRIKKEVERKGLPKDSFKVTKEKAFIGWDAYKQVLESGVDLVILATPPGFRPLHLAAAIEAGKHVFMEKPVAVDPVGVRSIIATSDVARQKGLAIVSGTQRRHQPHYLEIMKRIHNGDIGDLAAAQCYWCQGGVKFSERRPEWSQMEWQLQNWYYFTWLSGDIIVEQHVHNIDVLNWAFGSHPVKALGMGGRQVRNDEIYGNIYDHFAVEFEYPNGARALSMCRQWEGASNRISEHIVGTKGTAYTDAALGRIEGANAYQYDGPNPDPYVEEHKDLITSIRAGKPINEGLSVAESTMTGILGRMSAYTGREINWDWAMKESKLDLSPPRYEFGDLPVAPVAMPGQTQLI